MKIPRFSIGLKNLYSEQRRQIYQSCAHRRHERSYCSYGKYARWMLDTSCRSRRAKPADRHGKMLSKVVKNQSMLSVFGRVAPRCNTFFGAAETCVDHAFISDIDICTHAETIRTLHLSTDHAMLKLQLRINVLDLPRIPVPRAKCVIRFSLLKEQERRDDYRKKLANLLAEREVASHVFPSTENIQRLKDPVKLEGLCDLITRCITTAAEETLGRSSGRARKVRSRVWNKDLAEAWENVKHLKRVFLADPSQRLQETQFKNAHKRFQDWRAERHERRVFCRLRPNGARGAQVRVGLSICMI